MFLIIFGIIIFIITSVVVKTNPVLARFGSTGRIVALLMILLGISFGCIKQVDAGEVGVKKLFGSIQNDVLESGLHFINPLLDVEKVDVKTQNYTMSGVHNEGAV